MKLTGIPPLLLGILFFVVASDSVLEGNEENKKNRLPGDINGDGSVTVADFLILTDNFGRTDGDTFNPNDLVEASLLPITEPTTVTVTVRDTIFSRSPSSLPKPKITIEPGEWGDTEISTLQLVFESVRDLLSEHLMYPYDSDIQIIHHENGPSALYNRNGLGNYVVLIASEHNRWAQQIFQFAHEYAHILANYRSAPGYRQQLWFEESIAAMASLYALRSLSEKWKTDPPDGKSYFRNYANNGGLRKYWENIVVSTPKLSRQQFRDWYLVNRHQLEADAYLRRKNNVVAWNLIDIFENNPVAWNAVRYMNRGDLNKNENFRTYLSDWYLRTPPLWQPVVAEIMDRFGIILLNKPAVPTDRIAASPKGPKQ